MPLQSDKNLKTLVFVVGTRPNFVKLAPLWHQAIEQDWCLPILVHTGQHYDAALSDDLWRDLELPDPHENLGIGPGERHWQLSEIQRRLMAILPQMQPDGVVVFGDVNSTLAAARAAVELNLPLAHVEAGLRSFDARMVEEENRIAVDAISDILLTSEPGALDNLRREGINVNQVYAVGNLMVDCLRNLLPNARQLQTSLHQRYSLNAGNYAVLTIHRPENVDDVSGLVAFMDRISGMASQMPIVFPVHPRTRQQLSKVWSYQTPTGLILIEPLAYLEFLALIASARMVLTDSGGIQEETSFLGIPCITLRDNTERPITLQQGTNQLTGFDGDKANAAFKRLLQPVVASDAPSSVPAEWDGNAAGRIMQVLKNAWA